MFFFTSLSIPTGIQAKSLRVVTEDMPPYQIVEQGKLVGGSSYLLVKQTLQLANIDYEIEILPWARAYKTARFETNTLIFSLARTPEREMLFQWLLPVSQKQSFYYFSLKSATTSVPVTLEQIKKLSVVVVRDSAEHLDLMRMGFEEEKNMFLAVDYLDTWRMLLKKRAQFTYG